MRNTDAASNGLTAHAGGNLPAMPNLLTVPGSPGPLSAIGNDPELAALTPAQMFASVFRMSPDEYRRQPAAVTVDDCAASCSAKLAQAVQDHPGRPIWIDGDATFEADVVLGSALEPVIIVAGGNVQFAAPSIRINGLLYSRAADWNNTGNGAIVQGAAVAEGNFGGIGAPTFLYEPDILRRLNVSSGSLVRVPGSWRDF
jgi:hypothetical protein